MTKSVLRIVVFLALGTLALGGCRKESKTTGSGATETIAPAAAQPEATGTDAMTQTVDIEDSRSEADGGALTSPNPAARTTTTGTAATTTTATTTTAPPTTTTR
ncbi:MAG: hypothetical protein QOH21_1706 [Acidobacteriota bacterium]|nr:hypothetical protein [Acidobacteriota bacterium]